MPSDAGAAASSSTLSSSSSDLFRRHRPVTMKPLFAALLASLLCLQTESALTCFSCDKVDNNIKCLELKTCAETDRYCTTRYFGGGSGERHTQLISKGCSATCSELGLDIGVMAFSMKCCGRSLCNTSGAVSVKTSSLLLLVGTLASVFYIVGASL